MAVDTTVLSAFWFLTLTAVVLPLLVLLILSATALLIVRMVKGGSRRGSGAEVEETRMIQEVYRGLEELNRRVEALETISLEKQRSSPHVDES